MDGRIQMGGTRRRVRIKSWGRPAFGFIRRYGTSCELTKPRSYIYIYDPKSSGIHHSSPWNMVLTFLNAQLLTTRGRVPINEKQRQPTSSKIALNRFSTLSGFKSSWNKLEYWLVITKNLLKLSKLLLFFPLQKITLPVRTWGSVAQFPCCNSRPRQTTVRNQDIRRPWLVLTF